MSTSFIQGNEMLEFSKKKKEKGKKKKNPAFQNWLIVFEITITLRTN